MTDQIQPDPAKPEQFKPNPREAAQLAAQMNRRTVSVDDPYLQTLGLMTNNQMAANEVLYAQESEEYSTHGYWTSKAERNYFLTAPPEDYEAIRLLHRYAKTAPVMAEPFVTEWLEYLVEEDQMDRFEDPDDWKIPYPQLSQGQKDALLSAPELYPAMERELSPAALRLQVVWPMNPMQLRAFWRIIRLLEDEREFSLEWLQDVCSSNWFLTLEHRPPTSDDF